MRWGIRVFRIVLIALIIRTFVGEAAVVPTSSMEGTILVGDHLLLNKLTYGPELPIVGWKLPALKTVKRGNIIAFHYPRDPKLHFLKRVAAVGGDMVEIRDDILYINAIPVREPWARFNSQHSPRQPENMTARLVPAGQLFVLGDNRDNSDDSRYWGTVPTTNVTGEPLMIFWSYDAPTAKWLDTDPRHQMSFYASIATNIFQGTRWSRTGTIL